MSEQGIQISGVTRGAFIARGAFAAAAALGADAVGPYVADALGRSADDARILSFALTLEYLEADLYQQGLARLALSPQSRALAQELGRHEKEHVTALAAAVRRAGATPPVKPTFAFPATDERSFLRLAQAVEEVGVSAYNGAAQAARSRAVVATIGTIVQVEARHAAALRLLRGRPPALAAFDRALTEAQAQAKVNTLLKG